MLNRLTYLLPRSAFLRVALIIGLVIGLSLALALWFFARNAYAPGIQEYARLTVLQAETAKRHDWQSQEVVKRIGEATGITLRTNVPVQSRPLPFLSNQVVSRFQEAMEELLDEPVDVRLQNARPPILWVSAASFDGVWLRVPMDFFRDYDRYLLFAWGIATPLFAIIGGLLIASGLTRSLRRLKSMATRVAQGKTTKPIKGSSIAEIDATITAFNQMTRSLRQAEEDRVLLLSGVSHDLRTPLTRLRLALEIIEEETFRDDMIGDIDDMDAILSQFIAFVRNGTNEETIGTNLNALIEETTQKYGELVQLRLTPLPTLALRPVAMRRLLLNLVDNALKYGAAPVEIGTAIQGSQLLLTARDHGAGIDEADAARLLAPFERGEKARTSSGSGLGLAIVKRVVDMHHGRIHLRNHHQGGLVVSIYLPVT